MEYPPHVPELGTRLGGERVGPALGVPLTDEVTASHLCDNSICVRVTVDPDAAAGGFGVRHVVDGTQ